MAYIATTFHQGGSTPAKFRGNLTGQIWLVTASESMGTVAKRIYFPPGGAAIERLPSGANYGNRLYLVGGHSVNLVIDEEFRCSKQGMGWPDVMPTVITGAGSTLQICYLRFYDEVTNERGPLGAGLSITGNTSRTWTGIPTTVPDERVIVEGTSTIAGGVVTGLLEKTNFGDLRPGDRIAISTDLTRWARIRTITSQLSMTIDDITMAGIGVELVAKTFSRVSHVEQWVSVAGGLPRLATRVRLGVTGVIESTATLALGLPEIEPFENMPRGSFSVFYNDRQLIAGVAGHEDTVYLSMIGFPERFVGLQFVTKYNEPIIGMFKYRDYVVLLCPDSSYKLQGFTDADYVRAVLEPDIGGMGHHGNKVAEGRAFVPGRKGVQLFNGAFHSVIPTRRTEWYRTYSESAAGRLSFEDGFSVVNPRDGTFQFYPNVKWVDGLPSSFGLMNPPTPNTIAPLVWVGKYDAVAPQAGGAVSSPEWTSDTPATPDGGYVTYAAYLVINGEKVGKLYRGTSKGHIYVEDDGESAFTGTSIVVTRHEMFSDPGGGKQEGKKLIRMWSYVKNEESPGTIWVWPGDEYSRPPDFAGTAVPNLAVAAYVGAIPATLKEAGVVIDLDSFEDTYQPLITREHVVEKDGRGFTFEYRFINPNGVIFIGLGGVWAAPGTAARPVYIRLTIGT